MLTRVFKASIILCWLLLVGFLIHRNIFVSVLDSSQAALIQARYQQYYGVHLHERRIGYVMEEVRPLDSGEFQVVQQAHLRLKVLDTVQPVHMELHALLDSGMRLKTFQFSFSSPFYSTKAEGRAEGKTVHFTLDTGSTRIAESITLADIPLLPLNQRGYLLAAMKKEGDRLRVPFFDPFSLASRESIITYRGQEKELVGNRVHQLHHFVESYSGMNISFWLDDQGKIIKERSPAGFVFEAEPKFRALDIQDSGDELLAAVAVQYSGGLLPEKSQVAVYRLQFSETARVELDGGRQEFSEGRLVIRLEDFPPVSASAAQNCALEEYLQASRYVQSDHPSIRLQAQEIVGEEEDPVQQVALLANWVYTKLEKRPVIGLPDALSTLESRMGDCNEHAALFAALSRSIGIPTSIAAGVTLQNNAFYYHAWNEVCLQGQWISVDTTVNQLPADLYHIRFTRGDLEGQVAIGGLIGNLKIEILPEEAK
jgi:transglutaminase-like putative cysteine protease